MSKDSIKRIFFIAVGCLITSIGINAFIVPHRLLSGGVAGIGILLQYITGISSGIFILLINIPIFLYGKKEVDNEFAILSVFGIMFLSLFLTLTKGIREYISISDILLSCIYGGVLNGLGVGIALKNRGSMGGTDIIAVATKKKIGINIATLGFAINVVIVLLGSLVSSIETVLYTLISMYVSSKMIDKTLKGINDQKMLLIVTDKVEEVSKYIINDVHRGVTYLYGEGAYTQCEKKIMYCIVTLNQLEKVKARIFSIDKNAFVTILDASEVRGKGFKSPVF